MSDGASSEVSNAQSLLIRLLANFPGCLESLGVQGLAHSGCEPKLINWVSVFSDRSLPFTFVQLWSALVLLLWPALRDFLGRQWSPQGSLNFELLAFSAPSSPV